MFKKGQSGNPSGSNKRRLISNAIELELAQAAEDDDRPRARRIAQNVVALALSGDKWAVQFVTERTEGSPEQHVNITRHVHELSDDELLTIASGARDPSPPVSPEASQPLH